MPEERKGCVLNKQQAVRRKIISFEDLVCLIINPHVAVTDNFLQKIQSTNHRPIGPRTFEGFSALLHGLKNISFFDTSCLLT